MSGDKPRDSGRESRLPQSRSGKIAAVVVALLVIFVGVAAAAHISGTLESSGPNSIQAQDGMTPTLTGTSYQALWESNFPTTGSAEFITEQGNITFFSSGQANATVHISEIEGTWTNVTAIDADPNTITITPGDKDQAIVGQEIDTFAYRAGIAEDDGTTDFSYTASASARVTVQGVAASTRMAAIDASNGQILDDATSSSGGAVTFDSLDSGDHDVQIQTFNPAAPQFANPHPTGGTASAPTEVSVDVSDGDFPRGDSVTVTIDVDGSQVHSETISSNQTVTASVPSSGQTGGTHTWSVDASDSYGESNSDSYSYQVPKNLTIYDEETTALIDDRQVNLTVYTRGDSEQIYNFSTSDGNVDLGAGFPSSEPFVVVAEADGYLDRRIFVQNVYESQELYLLNESTQSTDVIFRIEDYTGNYPPDQTVLEVQRGISGNWTTVLGDYFGANDQFEAQIRFNERHRLVLVNSETGDRRVLGTYTPLASGTETLTVSPSGDLDLPDTHPTFEFSPDARTLPGNQSVDLSAGITAGDIPLTDWGVSVYHIDGNTNTTVFSDTSTDSSGGTVETSVDMSGREGTIKVVTSYTLDGGASGSRVATYNINAEVTESMALLDALPALTGLVPDANEETVMSIVSMILIVVGTTAIASVYPMSTEKMGAVTLALTATASLMGWVQYSLLFTVLVLYGGLVFLRRRY